MPTFNLDQYENKEDNNTEQIKEVEANPENIKNPELKNKYQNKKDTMIAIIGPLSKIVAQANYAAFKNDKNLPQEEKEEEIISPIESREKENSKEEIDETTQGSEEISQECLTVYALEKKDIDKKALEYISEIRKIKGQRAVYIANESHESYSTTKENWFLTVLEELNCRVILTQNEFNQILKARG